MFRSCASVYFISARFCRSISDCCTVFPWNTPRSCSFHRSSIITISNNAPVLLSPLGRNTAETVAQLLPLKSRSRSSYNLALRQHRGRKCAVSASPDILMPRVRLASVSMLTSKLFYDIIIHNFYPFIFCICV